MKLSIPSLILYLYLYQNLLTNSQSMVPPSASPSQPKPQAQGEKKSEIQPQADANQKRKDIPAQLKELAKYITEPWSVYEQLWRGDLKDNTDQMRQFVNFISRQGRKYQQNQKIYRYYEFKKNYKEVMDHNKNKSNTYSKGLNTFADMSQQQFQDVMLQGQQMFTDTAPDTKNSSQQTKPAPISKNTSKSLSSAQTKKSPETSDFKGGKTDKNTSEKQSRKSDSESRSERSSRDNKRYRRDQGGLNLADTININILPFSGIQLQMSFDPIFGDLFDFNLWLPYDYYYS